MSEDYILERNPVWDITQPAEFDRSIVEDTDYEIIENSGATAPQQTGDLIYRISSPNDFFDLSESYFLVRFDVTAVGGAALPAGSLAAPSLGAMSLFSSAKLEYAKTDIESHNLGLPWLQLLKSLTLRSESELRTEGSLEFNYLNTSTQPDDELVLNGLEPNPAYNDGFTKAVRRCHVTGSNIVEAHIPLRVLFDYVRFNPRVLRGQDIVIRLVPAREEYCFRDAVNVANPVVINLRYLTLYARKVRPSEAVATELISELTDKTYIQCWDQCSLNLAGPTLQAGPQTQSIFIANKDSKIRAAVIAFVRDDVYVGTTQVHPAAFVDAGVSRMSLAINSQFFPRDRPYTPSWNAAAGQGGALYNGVSRLYREYLKHFKTHSHADDVDAPMDFDQFCSVYPLYCIDTDAQNQTLSDASTRSDVRLEVTLNPAVAVRCLVMLIVERRAVFHSLSSGANIVIKNVSMP